MLNKIVRKVEINIPPNFQKNIYLICRRNELTTPKESAEELYKGLRKLPSKVIREFQKIINDKPYLPYDRKAIIKGEMQD